MNDTTTRNDLIGMISDDYKTLYGVRPRGYKFDEMTVEELQAWSNELSQSIHEQIAYERGKRLPINRLWFQLWLLRAGLSEMFGAHCLVLDI